MKRKLSWVDGLTAFGTAVTVLGHTLYLGGGDNAAGGQSIIQNTVKLVGIAAFMAGIFITLRQVSTELQSLAQSHAGAQQALAIGESSFRLRTLNRWCEDNPSDVHIRVATQLATGLLDTYTPRLLGQIDAFHNANTDEIEIRNIYPASDLLEHLAQELPAGSVWLSHSTRMQRVLWAEGSEAFGAFAQTIRARTEAGSLTLLRLYRSSTVEEWEDTRTAKNCVPLFSPHVRYNIGPEPAQDVALLYAPSDKTKLPFAVPPAEKVTESLTAAGFELLCVLTFDVRADGSLKGIKIHRSTSADAKSLPGHIGLLWQVAKSV